jgi:hypothetical protein
LSFVLNFYKFLLSPFIYLVELIQDWIWPEKGDPSDPAGVAEVVKTYDKKVADLHASHDAENVAIDNQHKTVAAASAEQAQKEANELASKPVEELTGELAKSFQLKNKDLPQ